MSVTPQDILSFWFDETPTKQHFIRDDDFDTSIRDRFQTVYNDAAAGHLDDWAKTADGTLALIILLDQFSRNLYRDSPQAFDQDLKTVTLVTKAVERGDDLALPETRRAFLYLPLMHSEDLSVQDKCVALYRERLPGSSNIPFAEQHHATIKKFGRFPYRNKAFGRETTPEEQKYLKGKA